MLKQLFFIIIVIAIANQSQSQTSSHYLIVYPNTAEAVPMNDSTLITGDSVMNALIGIYQVYEYSKIDLLPEYWPHPVLPYTIYLNNNADSLSAELENTGYFDSII